VSKSRNLCSIEKKIKRREKLKCQIKMVKDRDREVRDQAKGKAVEERVIVEEEKRK